MERFFDLVFSSLALVILSPLLFPIIVILRLSGEGEIFFLQDRVGKNGKVFKLFKFATMLKDSPNIGSGTLTIKNDPRILPVGKLLRKTKINELPQLLNIFWRYESYWPKTLSNSKLQFIFKGNSKYYYIGKAWALWNRFNNF